MPPFNRYLYLALFLFFWSGFSANAQQLCDREIQQSKTLYLNGQYAEAGELLLNCLRIGAPPPQQQRIRQLLSYIYLEDERSDAAKAQVEKILAIDANYQPPVDASAAYQNLVKESQFELALISNPAPTLSSKRNKRVLIGASILAIGGIAAMLIFGFSLF